MEVDTINKTVHILRVNFVSNVNIVVNDLLQKTNMNKIHFSLPANVVEDERRRNRKFTQNGVVCCSVLNLYTEQLQNI